jgi:uncharacterized protein
MKLSNEFHVPVPVDRAWAVLLDVERVAPCMPGATLTAFDGGSFAGTVKVKLGPVSLTYAGKGSFVTRDFVERRVVIEASGKDSRGTGTAAATVTAELSPDGDGTRVRVGTELHITGAAAQLGRGMVDQVAGRLIAQFGDCLASTISAEAVAAEAVAAAVPAGVAGNGSGKPHAMVPAEAQPIDLLQVSGAKRIGRYALVAVALVLLGAVLIWWLR